MTEPEPLLTVRQVAAWLGLTERAVRDRVQRRAIPFRRVGRCLRFDRAEIEAWTKASQEPPRFVLGVQRRRRKAPGSIDEVLKELGYR